MDHTFLYRGEAEKALDRTGAFVGSLQELGAVDFQFEGQPQVFCGTLGEHHTGEEDLEVIHNGADAGVDGEVSEMVPALRLRISEDFSTA